MNFTRLLGPGLAVLIGASLSPAPARAADTASSLDLTPYFHTNFFHARYKGPAVGIRGVQTVDGLPFQLVGQAGFFGQTLAERGTVYRDRAAGIVVGAKFDELHLIHHAFWPDQEGQIIAWFRLNYADGGRFEFPIIYGAHVRDWFRLPSEPRETLSDPDTTIFWRGTSPGAERLKATVRLFKSAFANPFPQKVVTTLDIWSARQQSSYSLIAATVAMKDERRPRTRSVPPLGPERELDGAVVITVVDAETGAPIAGALIEHGMSIDGAGVVSPPVTTSDSGEAVIRYQTGKTSSINVTVKRDGYAPKSEYWRDGAFPPTHTFRLTPGVAVGGWVRDENRQHLSGARVRVYGISSGSGGGFSSQSTTSGEDGRWTVNGIPPTARNLRLDVQKGDSPPARFSTDAAPGAGDGESFVALHDLFSQVAVLTLRRGLSLTGRVQNEAGRPITNATLRVGQYRYDSDTVTARSDPEGKFELKNLKPGNRQLTVWAGGYAPEVLQVDIREQNPPLTIVLAKGGLILGRVVDTEGKPIEGADVSVGRFERSEMLDWKTKTDAEGRFRWGGAPREGAQLDIRKAGYMALRWRTVKPGPDEQVFVLTPPMRVYGTVRDAQTQEPVPAFRIVPGWPLRGFIRPGDTNAPARHHWNRYGSKNFKDGNYEMTFSEPPVIGTPEPYDYVLLAEADGYAPAASPAIKASEALVEVNFELAPAANFIGVLQTPDGKPVPDKQIIIVLPGSASGQLRNGQLMVWGSREPSVLTDAEGRFKIPPQLGDFLVLAATDAGFARVTRSALAANPIVILQPWGRIEGVKRYGRRPAVGESLALTFEREPGARGPQVYINDYVTTGPDGRFTFERVPPGPIQVYQRVFIDQHSWTHKNPQLVDVIPGGTNHIVIGGDGTLGIIAKLIRPAGLDKSVSLTNCSITLRRTVPGPQPPADLNTREERQKWFAEWNQTDAGKAYHAAMAEQFFVQVERDGTLRGEGLVPAEYVLHVSILRASNRSRPGFSPEDVLASATKKFELKAPEKPDDDAPVNLGKIELVLHRQLKVGDIAPPFSVKTLDGQPLKLADFKGRFVLLDFWATWCGPCIAELPHLKETFDAFGKDKRFAMIGLSLDAEAETAKKFTAKNEMKWIQGFLGDWSKDTVTKQYGVQGIPATFLIGPDGRIIAKDLRGERLKQAVEKALKQE